MEIRELLLIERNVFITISVMLLLLYVITQRAFPKIFETNYHPGKLVAFRLREEIGYSLKPFSKGQLFLTGIYSLTLSFLLLFLIQHWNAQNDLNSAWFLFESFWSGLLYWLILSIGIFLLIFIKLAFLYLVSLLFHLGQGYQRQFIDFFNTSSVFVLISSVILSAMLYGQLVSGEMLADLLIKITVAFLFYRTILIYIKLLQSTEYSKLYIFSYICTTELIPLFIGLKYLIR